MGASLLEEGDFFVKYLFARFEGPIETFHQMGQLFICVAGGQTHPDSRLTLLRQRIFYDVYEYV